MDRSQLAQSVRAICTPDNVSIFVQRVPGQQSGVRRVSVEGPAQPLSHSGEITQRIDSTSVRPADRGVEPPPDVPVPLVALHDPRRHWVFAWALKGPQNGVWPVYVDHYGSYEGARAGFDVLPCESAFPALTPHAQIEVIGRKRIPRQVTLTPLVGRVLLQSWGSRKIDVK